MNNLKGLMLDVNNSPTVKATRCRITSLLPNESPRLPNFFQYS